MTRQPGKRHARARRGGISTSPAVARRRPPGLRLTALVLVNLLVLVLLWTLVEVGARLWFPRDLQSVFDNPRVFQQGRPYVQDDAQRGFVLRSGYSTPRMTVTRQGFRAHAPVMQEEDLAPARIICLGGSTTFGWGLADHESYPAQLQQQLGGFLSERVSIINAGVPSYTSEQVRRYLGVVLDTHPRLVIVQSMWNDLLFSFVDNWFPDLLVHQRPSPWRRFLLEHSAAYRAAVLRPPHPQATVRSSPEALEHFRSNLEDILQLCRERRVPVLFSLPPMQEARVPEEGMRIGAQRVPKQVFLDAVDLWVATLADVAQQHDVPLVRHRVAREAAPAPELFLDAAHPTAAGYALLAADLVTAILELEVLEGSAAAVRP